MRGAFTAAFAPAVRVSVRVCACACACVCLGQMYLPVHVLPLLLFRLAALRRAPAAALGACAAGVVRSCLFMTAYTSVLRAGVCTLRHARGRDEWWHAAACGLATGLAARLESPRRTHELMLYCAVHALDVLWGLARERGLVSPVRGGDALLFAGSLAVLLALDRDAHGGLHGSVRATRAVGGAMGESITAVGGAMGESITASARVPGARVRVWAVHDVRCAASPARAAAAAQLTRGGRAAA